MSLSERRKTLVKYVVPTILSSVCFYMFTIIDGVFVGHGVGTDALGAVNIAFPYVMVVSALFMLTTIGGITITAIRLGRGDESGANKAFMHSLAGTLIVSALMSAAGLIFTGAMARLLGANETYFVMVRDYLFWYSVFLIPSGLATVFMGFARNDGAPILCSAAVIVSTVVNIFGDWLCVFPLQMGVKGAAIATGASQCVGLLIVLTHFIRKQGKLRIVAFEPDAALAKKIVLRGLPEMINQFAAPVAILTTNYVLLYRLGEIAVNSFSIIGYVASFSVAVFFGTATGLQPLFGNCYGAKDEEGLKYYFRSGVIINLVGSVLITILLYYVGGPVCALFGADPKTLEYTVAHMAEYSWGFIVMSLNSIISSYLYSTKRTKEAVILNLLRSFVLDTVVIILTPIVFGNEAVWFGFVGYELMALLVAYYLLRRSEKNGVVFR